MKTEPNTSLWGCSTNILQTLSAQTDSKLLHLVYGAPVIEQTSTGLQYLPITVHDVHTAICNSNSTLWAFTCVP